MAHYKRIDAAIHRCIRAALRGPKTPLATLATSLDELREDPSWNRHDIERVKAVAYRRLVQPARFCTGDHPCLPI
jgi:hypothetical protein